jgi:hypothetical protein
MRHILIHTITHLKHYTEFTQDKSAHTSPTLPSTRFGGGTCTTIGTIGTNQRSLAWSLYTRTSTQERTAPYAGGENEVQAWGKVSIKVNKHNIAPVITNGRFYILQT